MAGEPPVLPGVLLYPHRQLSRPVAVQPPLLLTGAHHTLNPVHLNVSPKSKRRLRLAQGFEKTPVSSRVKLPSSGYTPKGLWPRRTPLSGRYAGRDGGRRTPGSPFSPKSKRRLRLAQGFEKTGKVMGLPLLVNPANLSVVPASASSWACWAPPSATSSAWAWAQFCKAGRSYSPAGPGADSGGQAAGQSGESPPQSPHRASGAECPPAGPRSGCGRYC